MENSKIEWTDHTANFWWGCFKVSPGCKNCYAEMLAHRYGKNIWGPVATTDRERKTGIWAELLRWNRHAMKEQRRRRVFVQSMSDFFEDHPQVGQWREDALSLISKCKWLDFQILTKRPENVNRMIADYAGDCEWLGENIGKDNQGRYSNIWIGTSVENQAMADKRIPELMNIPAIVRFLSVEPLLESVTLNPWLLRWPTDITGKVYMPFHWVIVGGESGHNKRPFNPDWARAIRDLCKAAGVPFFMKQIDKVQPIPADLMIREFPR